MIPTMFIVSILIFSMIRLIPGDIVVLMLRSRGHPSLSDRAVLEQELGFDVPVLKQYGRWVGVVRDKDGSFSGVLQGDLGDSLWKHTPVVDEIVDRVPVTLELGLLALIIAQLISLPIGIYSAIRQDSAGDYVGRSLATVLIALPNFWVGLMIIILGSLWFGWSPPLKVISFTEDPIGNLGMFIVPAFIMGMAETGTAMRMTRSMMLEVLRQDYIRTAWAKGLGERVVTMRHALKNALIPVITLIGLQIPYLLGGAVIIETIFGLPGMGRLLVEATMDRDYTIVSGVVFSFAVLLILTNIAVDLTYGYLDPRVRYK
ncbi:Dipeptide transport system permease protein DppB [subsurface metagenome]